MHVSGSICHPWLDGAAKGQDRTVLEKQLRDSNLLSKVHEMLQDSLPWVKYEPWQWFLNLASKSPRELVQSRLLGPALLS